MKRLAIVAAMLAVLTLGSLAAHALVVYDITALPNVLESYTYLTAQTLPSQYPLDVMEINVYNLSYQLVATLAEEDTYRIYWNGGEIDEDEFGPYFLYIAK